MHKGQEILRQVLGAPKVGIPELALVNQSHTDWLLSQFTP